MAESWGNEVNHGTYNRWQCICNAWVSSYPNATQAVITVQAILYTPWAISSAQYYGYTEVSGWGSGENQGGVNTPNSPTRTVIREQSFTVNRPQGSDANFTCVARVRNTGSYSPGTSTASVSVPVSHIAYTTPRTPKNQKVTKNSDYQATVSWTGDYTGMDGTQPWTGVYIDRKTDSGSWTQIATVSWDKTSYVDKGITTGHSYQYGLRSYGPGGTSGRVTTGTITTSYTPNAPTTCSASRVSDSQGKVTWKDNPATNRPYVNLLLERQTDSGSWTQIASLGSTAVNYTDNGLSANHRYAYRVRAKNNAGYSGYATSGYIYTTPKAPSSVTVSKVSNTQVSVNITGAAAWATSYNVQYSLNGGSWTSAGSTTAWPYKHTPGGGTVKYRVQAVRGSLASGWVESGTVQTVMPPNAPSVSLSPAESVVPVGTALTVSWRPNHPDGSAQSAAQVEVTVGTAAATVKDVTGTATTYALGSQASATTIKVRVRTKGLDPDWGAWSSYATVSVAVVPTGYFTYPATDGANVGGVPLDASWSVTDPAGVASQTLYLTDASGGVLYSTQLAGSARGLSIGYDRYLFANMTDYRIAVEVLSGSGLSARFERLFRTNWAGPADPSPSVSYGSGKSAVVNVGSYQTSPVDRVTISRPEGSILPGLTVTAADPASPVSEVTVVLSADGETASTEVPIDLGGSVLRAYDMDGFDDMVTDELVIDETGAVTLTRRVGDDGNPLEEPVTTSLGTIEMPLLPSDETVVWVDGDAPAKVSVHYPDTASYSVVRVLQDGSQAPIDDGLCPGEQAIDRIPPLNTPFSYIVTAYADSGVTSSTRVDAEVASDMEAYNFGVDGSVCVELGFDASGSEGISHSGETYRFALGPDTPQLPTFYPDGDIDVTGSHSYVTYDEALYRTLRRLARGRGNSLCWFRDCFGNRARVLASWSLSYDAKSYRRFDVSADLTEVVFEEPANG